MSTPHISAEKGDFAKTVLMPGDPLRAKFIAEITLKNISMAGINLVAEYRCQFRPPANLLHFLHGIISGIGIKYR